MAFEIPNEYIAEITTLKTLPDSSIEAFISTLNSTPFTADTDDMAARIAERVPSIPAKRWEAVLDALYSIYYIRELSGVPHPTFLQDFMEGVQNLPELAVPKQELSKLRAKFEKLLSIDRFNVFAKAKRLQRDGERLYCDAKILSDIRPVFGAKPTTRPTGAVITHTLKVAYHEGGEHKEFHIVLDAIDLDELVSVILRAYDKDKTLRKLLKDARLPVMGV
jgi:hypothetical protein